MLQLHLQPTPSIIEQLGGEGGHSPEKVNERPEAPYPLPA
jgi:hypothetical protein